MGDTVDRDMSLALAEAHTIGVEEGRAEVRAAVEAVIEREDGSGLPADFWWIRNLSAALADPAVALAEHDRQLGERIAQAIEAIPYGTARELAGEWIDRQDAILIARRVAGGDDA